MRLLPNVLLLSLVTTAAPAEKPDELKERGPLGGGQVQIPLDVYSQLVESSRTRHPRQSPGGYALGNARVTVTVQETEPRPSAEVAAVLRVEVLESEWVLIPLLPLGTPVESATVGGKTVSLSAGPAGLSWSTKEAGAYDVVLKYRVDAIRSASGFVLAVPLPQAASIQLEATLPGTGLEAAVIPGVGVRVASSGGTTRISATIPTTSGAQISWRTPGLRGHTVSRANYRGRLAGDVILWTTELGVETWSEETATVKLLPRSVTLSEVKVDGREAPILVEGSDFATLVKGRGLHRVTLGFQTPVLRNDGPPRVELALLEIPVSRMELTLPGKKEVHATPVSGVSTEVRGATTVAALQVPMSSRVVVSWSEGIPDAAKAEVRANASIYHALYAQEGVLYARGTVQFEVSRGETNVIELLVPPDVQVNRVSAPAGSPQPERRASEASPGASVGVGPHELIGVLDWRLARPQAGRGRPLTVYLDRPLRDQMLLEVLYDRSLDRGRMTIPLVQAGNAQRQRGMVALLSTSELALNPVDEGGATRVGENQLPAFVRENVKMTVAHTFKYVETAPRLVVETAAPERAAGKLDARVATLVTLGDATLRGSASVEIHVKSGRVSELKLTVPSGVNVLGLTAPSLRSYDVGSADGRQVVNVQFTQEMEGDFRVELQYERILQEAEAEFSVPLVSVGDVEIEQGQVAVEAASAVEVKPLTVEQLLKIETSELPRQLVLRTTHPILLAYKYAQAQPPPRLTLGVARHRVVDVQEAVIDEAHYRTLVTRDGLAVTVADFSVRNYRKQFFGIELPPESEVWASFVDGKAAKPALAEGASSGGGRPVLLKMIHATNAFPLQIVYATRQKRIGALGFIHSFLPRPDILVTVSRWDVYLPEGIRYGAPSTNMAVKARGIPVTGQDIETSLAKLDKDAALTESLQPLRIHVPTSGVHYAFEKLYANQQGVEAGFRIAYASTAGSVVGNGVSFIGVALLWLGIGLRLRRDTRISLRVSAALLAAGIALLALTIGVYDLSAALPLVASIAFGIALAALYGKKVGEAWRRARTSRQERASSGSSPG